MGRKISTGWRCATTLAAQPITGWLIKVAHAQGDTTLRIYKTWGNTDGAGITVTGNTALIVPPFLTPGDTWFVEVEGSGLTNYTITSFPITLQRPVWTMAPGHNNTFGDSGNDSNGASLPGDRGTDIGQDDWHFYAIDVPAGNAGLLRTELQAINGNPNLYLREDGVPTTDHDSNGGDNYQDLVHRSLISDTGSEYGNWVPWNGRTEKQLRAGRWYLAVKASGGTNARYRLIASTGQVTDLALNGGSVTNQILVGRDWRYYRFTVPADAPNTWNLTFSQQVGDVNMWLRDTVPPGNQSYGFETSSDPSQYSLRTWNTDGKNQGPYSTGGQDAAGAYPFNTPPLRPGSTYYVGFRRPMTPLSRSAAPPAAEASAPCRFSTSSPGRSMPACLRAIPCSTAFPCPRKRRRMKWTATHDSRRPGPSGTGHPARRHRNPTLDQQHLESGVQPIAHRGLRSLAVVSRGTTTTCASSTPPVPPSRSP